MNNPHKTDSRSLYERKHSVTLRVGELRTALAAAERCAAQIDTEIEEYERGVDSRAAE